MCGIVGIISNRNSVERIISSLKRLEYRGYDSAGLAVVKENKLEVCKVAGKIEALRAAAANFNGNIGIGHTRWATHGPATSENAHPHLSKTTAVVHNGIIENHEELRESLRSEGVSFVSQTDTEVIPHLLESLLNSGLDLNSAAISLLKTLEGSYAVASIINSEEPQLLVLKKGAPLAIGIGTDEMFIGSDALALAPFTSQIVYLEDGDFAILSQNSYQIYDSNGLTIDRPVKHIGTTLDSYSKGDYKHFMLKEINEESEVLTRVLQSYYDAEKDQIKIDIDFAKFKRIYIIACGTSFYAASVAKYWFEKYAKIPVEIDIASEFRYRAPIIEKDSIAIFVSQSGETSDTLAALKEIKGIASYTAAIVNVVESSIANSVDYVLPIMAGYEIGVASTKAFVNQLGVIAMMVLKASQDRSTITNTQVSSFIKALFDIPACIDEITARSSAIKNLANKIKKASTVLFLGRGTSYPIALEGALKLKELSYIHAEGFAAGELKHGPIALIDDSVPIIAIAPSDEHFAKTSSNIAEVKARNGLVICLCDQKGASSLKDSCDETFILPEISPFITPIVYAIPLQLLAYYAADLMGKDVDQPRNLAKSVTVE